MKKVSIALAAAGLLALSACGGGSDTNAASNNVEEVNVSADDLTVTNLDSNALGNDTNALGGDAGNLANATDSNATDVGAGNAAANGTGNSQ